MKNYTSTLKLSIVIPVYRSALILPKLVGEIKSEMAREGLLDDFELLLINDSSPDNSWQVICELAKIYPFIKGVSLRRNFGQHNAIMAGLNCCCGDYVILMDDDLQHPPQAIGEILNALHSGYDVCYTKYVNRQHVLWKKLGSQFNDWVATRLLEKPKGLYLSSFKGVTAEIAQEIIQYDGPYAYVDGLILEVTKSITSIEIAHQARHEGEGNYDLRRSISLWMKMATSFSVLPLRLASYLGFALASVSFLMIAFVVIERLLHPEYPPGWASLIAVILFIGGVQMLCIGMIGEYLGRTYLKINKTPQFVIGKRHGGQNNKND